MFINLVSAKRSLSATSLVTCLDDSQITPSYFNVTFNPDDLSLQYNVDLTTEINGYVIGHVQVYAYGFLIIEQDIDLCDLGWKQFCPLFPGSLQVNSIQYISEDTASQIPGIAYQVPDIDAVIKVVVRDVNSGEDVSCLQASFSNGKTVAQTGAKWATAVVAGLGLLIAAVLSTFGNSNAASNISANAVSLFLYFQSVVVVSMQAVERLPPIASAWAENLAWSMGLIRIQFMQDIFRWYVQSTGGNPTLYFKGTTQQILVQRAYSYLDNLHQFVLGDDDSIMRRLLDFGLSSNFNLIILRGIKRIGYNSHIEPTSIVVTGFTFFVIIGYLLVVVLFFAKQIIDLLIRFKKMNPNNFNYFRRSFFSILKGALLRYIYIGFTQLVILSLWEFTQNDSPAVIVLGILFLILALGVICWSCYKTLLFGKKSIQKYSNPAAILYGDAKVLNKYGFCYTMFNASKYWFGSVVVAYNLVKGIFIALCQPAAKASVVIVFVLDLAFTIYLFLQAPYLNKPTNIINYCISIVTTINSFLFLFFSGLFGQPAPVASVMAWIFFILNAAFALILLIFVIVFSSLSVLSKNPDARFAPAKDDRTSFQRKSSVKRKSQLDQKNPDGANELFALGAAAQEHNSDWENEVYKLNDETNSNVNLFTPELKGNDTVFADEKINDDSYSSNEDVGLGAKIRSIKRTFSKKDHLDNARLNNGNLTRLSDNLNEDSVDNDESDSFIGHKRNDSNLSVYGNNPTGAKPLV